MQPCLVFFYKCFLKYIPKHFLSQVVNFVHVSFKHNYYLLQLIEFNKEEADERLRNLPWISTESMNIDCYFTKAELDKLCDIEKLRYKNIKRNYLTMELLG